MTRDEFRAAGGASAGLKALLLDGRTGRICGLTTAGVLRIMTIRGEIPEEVNVLLADMVRVADGTLAQCRRL